MPLGPGIVPFHASSGLNCPSPLRTSLTLSFLLCAQGGEALHLSPPKMGLQHHPPLPKPVQVPSGPLLSRGGCPGGQGGLAWLDRSLQGRPPGTDSAGEGSLAKTVVLDAEAHAGGHSFRPVPPPQQRVPHPPRIPMDFSFEVNQP